MLIDAWRKHLPFSGPRSERGSHETWYMYKQRTSREWGLMEWLFDSFQKLSVNGVTQINKLLIEGKALGISAAQELQNRLRLPRGTVQVSAGGDYRDGDAPAEAEGSLSIPVCAGKENPRRVTTGGEGRVASTLVPPLIADPALLHLGHEERLTNLWSFLVCPATPKAKIRT